MTEPEHVQITRTELRAARALTPAQRRTRRAEHRRQHRLLTEARREQLELAHARRRHARARQRDINQLRYRGHPPRTSRLTGRH